MSKDIVKEIRRATHRKFSAEEKIRNLKNGPSACWPKIFPQSLGRLHARHSLAFAKI